MDEPVVIGWSFDGDVVFLGWLARLGFMKRGV